MRAEGPGRLSEGARQLTTQEIPLLEVFEIGNRTAGIRNTGNAITRMAQVAFSYMSKFGGSPGIHFGAKPITSQFPEILVSVLSRCTGFIIKL